MSSRKFLLINSNLVGTSRRNRPGKWRLSDNERRGHPMVSRRGGIDSDYLRRSMARYFSWKLGTYPNNYKKFGYLNDDLLDAQASLKNTVGVNVSHLDSNKFPDLNGAVLATYGDFQNVGHLFHYPSYVFGAPPPNTPHAPFTISGDTRIEDLDPIVLSGSDLEWGKSSVERGVTDVFAELFNDPWWTNWQAYVMGGTAVTIDDDDTPERQFYGLFGDSAGTLYADHVFLKDLPPDEQVAVGVEYNYYDQFFDEMRNNSSISELYIPNLYMVYSVTSNSGTPLYPALYGSNDASRAIVTETLSSSIGAPLNLGQDYLDDNSIPLGQIQASFQAPDSLLNRFSRKDFSSGDLQAVRNHNRHLGLAPELLVSPNSDFSDISGRQGSFPYSAKVSFPADGTGDLFDPAFSLDAFKLFLFEVMKANILNFNTSSYGFYEQAEFSAVEGSAEGVTKYYGFDWTNPGSWIPSNNPEARETYKVNMIDVPELFDSMFEQFGNQYGDGEQGNTYNGFINQTNLMNQNLINGEGYIIGQEAFTPPVASEYDSDEDYNVFQNSSLIFMATLGQKLIDETRTYEELLGGEHAYHKTLVYKLDKHLVDPNTNQPLPDPIQSIYFPNSLNGNITYHDTQVKFGQRYAYKAYSYDLVVGNEYRYTNPEVYPPVAAPYPSSLAELMGFTMTLGNDTAQFDISLDNSQGGGFDAISVRSFMPWSDKEIYVGNPVSYTAEDLLGSTFQKTLNLTVNQDWFNENYSFYFDYSIVGQSEPYFTKELQNVVTPLTNPGNVLINLTQVAAQIQEALGPLWRVRFVPDRIEYNNSGTRGGRFVIGRASDLRDLTYSEIVALMDVTLGQIPQATPVPGFNTLFGITNAWLADLNPHTFLFRSGPHGSVPDYPWDLSRAGEADVRVQNYRSVKIMELPYFETNPFEVVDLPPQFPDVDIVPLKGENKKIKILLNESATRNSYLPMIIEEADVAKFEEVRISQGRAEGEPLVFGSDDSIVSFQIYRLDTAPQAYTDFAGNLRDTLETFTPAGRSITTATKLDSIEPNVAYYYCFRTIDKNGFISVPSPILKVQMIDDNGRIYPIIEPYALPNSETRSTERSFKRYLEIDTSLESKRVNIDSAATSAGNPLIPPASNVSLSGSVWGDGVTFKVRLVSKDTGRKLDLNLNFNMEGIPNPNLQGD